MNKSIALLKKLTSKKPSVSKQVPTIRIGNSYSKIEGLPEDVMKSIASALTYTNEEVKKEKARIFMAMKAFQRYGNNKAYYAYKKQLETLPAETVCLMQGNEFPTGLLNVVQSASKLHYTQHVSTIDTRVIPEPYETFKWENRPPPARYYQDEVEALLLEHERGVVESAVGSGKTRMIADLIRNKGVNTLVIVPSVVLLEQTYRTLYRTFGGRKVQIVKSATLKSKKKLTPVRVMNVQTLASLQKKGQLDRVISDIDMVIVDEVHHSGAKTYTDLLRNMDHIYFRYGFTGTFLRNDSKTMDMHGFLSNKIYEYSPSKAVSDGFLTPTEYVVSELPGYASKDYQREYKQNYCRNQHLFRRIYNICQSVGDDQVLILVERKDEAGKILNLYLDGCGIKNVYISGDDKKERVADILEKFNSKEIKVLIGTSVIGEGVDVHSTKHLIIATGGKSEIRLVQAIGRCVRLHEGKPKSYVYDFAFRNTNYLEKHLRKRMQIYENNFAGEISYVGFEPSE